MGTTILIDWCRIVAVCRSDLSERFASLNRCGTRGNNGNIGPVTVVKRLAGRVRRFPPGITPDSQTPWTVSGEELNRHGVLWIANQYPCVKIDGIIDRKERMKRFWKTVEEECGHRDGNRDAISIGADPPFWYGTGMGNRDAISIGADPPFWYGWMACQEQRE
jgi:hypothetical protein